MFRLFNDFIKIFIFNLFLFNAFWLIFSADIKILFYWWKKITRVDTGVTLSYLFSLNKPRIGNRIRAYDVRILIQEAQKTRIRLHIFYLYWYFIPLFVRLRFSRKDFTKNFCEKLTKFCENCDTLRRSFVFAKGQKSVFIPTLAQLCKICQKGAKLFVA
jgi:hypothetical protein